MDTLARRAGRNSTPTAPARPESATKLDLAASGLDVVPRRRAAGLRTPPGAWRWWETVGLGLAVSLLVAAIVTLDPSGMTAEAVSRRVTVIGNTLALAASVLLYVHWRMVGGGPLAWLVLGLSAMAVHLLTMAGLAAADPDRIADRPGMILLTRCVLAAGILSVALLWNRGLRMDPLAVGVGLGSLLFAGRYAALLLTPHLNLDSTDLHRLSLVVLLLDLCIAVGVAAFPKAPRWVRYRLAAALAVIAFAHAATFPVPMAGWYGASVAVGGQVLGATILLSLSISLVRLSIRDNRSAIKLLREHVLRAEALKRDDQARLHEIRATIAGISNAARIVHEYQALAPARRERISDMMNSEINRLERLTSAEPDRAVVEVDLDATLDPLVERIASQGHRVHSNLSGDTVVGRADDIAEIISVLLENAVRHGGDAEVMLTSRRLPDAVEIVVSDSGPGVPAGLQSRIFDWGASGPQSTGDGIGLHVARDLADQLDGRLDLVASEAPGATFVLTLPAPGREA